MKFTPILLVVFVCCFFTIGIGQNALIKNHTLPAPLKPIFNAQPINFLSIDTFKREKSEKELANLVSNILNKHDKASPRTAYLVGSSSVAVFGGLFVYMKQAWWKEETTKFHFDWSRDYTYANNLDKMGHFMGGIIAADAYFDACKGLKMSDKSAAWWGFGIGAGVQMAIEIKDGLAPHWGYSVGDVTAGSLGALQPLLRQKSSFFRHTDFKASYWQRSTRYFEARGLPITAIHTDDYLNQTYWMSTSLRYLTNEKYDKIPDWLNLAFGWGIEAESWDRNPLDPGTGGKPEFYLALDVNLLKLFKPKQKFWYQFLKRINYLKVPMPTLQLTQKPKLWGLYF